MTQILPSRSNQVKFSKSNTAPQSAGTVVHGKNTKEHLKNKSNQKDLPQLIRNISTTSLKLNNYAQNVLGKQTKKRGSRQKSFHLFPSKIFIQVIDRNASNKRPGRSLIFLRKKGGRLIEGAFI